MIRWAPLLLLGAALSVCPPLGAHPLAPLLLQLDALPGTDGTELEVRFKAPLALPPRVVVEPELPEECRRVGSGELVTEGTGLVHRFRLRCPGGLVGREIGVAGLAQSGSDALVRITLTDGRRIVEVLDSGRSRFVVPARQAVGSVVVRYAALGVEHILLGPDHLLFVLGLLLLARTPRSLLATVTSFTAGHSVTLSLAVLGYVSFSQRLAEGTIAASLFLLAVEISRQGRRDAIVAGWRPAVLAGGFGLLHGLGFAGALTDAGLPSEAIPLALASFNVGIEVGQVAFVLGVLLLAGLTRSQRLRARVLSPATYLIGTLGVYWTLERLWAL